MQKQLAIESKSKKHGQSGCPMLSFGNSVACQTVLFDSTTIADNQNLRDEISLLGIFGIANCQNDLSHYYLSDEVLHFGATTLGAF